MSKNHQHPRQVNASAQQAIKALLSDKPVAYHPALARAVGSVNAAIFLSQLLYWLPYTDDAEGWIWKTREEIANETALSRTEQENARRVLVRIGVIEEKLRKLPARMHFRIDVDRLVELLGALEPLTPNGGRTARSRQPRHEDPAADQPGQLAGNLPTSWEGSHQPVGGKPANKEAGNLPAISVITALNTAETTHHHPPAPAPVAQPEGSQRADAEELSLLLNRQIGKRVARKLLALPHLTPELLTQQLAVYDWRLAQGDAIGTGYLIRSLETPEDYPPPPGYLKAQQHQAARSQAEARARQEAEVERQRRQAELEREALEHLSDPVERATHRVAEVERIYAIAKRPPPFSPAERPAEIARRAETYREQARRFFEQHPDLHAWALAQLDPPTETAPRPSAEPTDRIAPPAPQPEPPANAPLSASEARRSPKRRGGVSRDLPPQNARPGAAHAPTPLFPQPPEQSPASPSPPP